MVTVELAYFEGSAWLVAVTVALVWEVTAGAVKRPPGVIVPPLADQLTAVFAVPLTVAENCCCWPDNNVVLAGVTLIFRVPPPPNEPPPTEMENVCPPSSRRGESVTRTSKE